MSEVVTGEAVVVSVRVAAMPSRAAALLIDLLVQGALLVGATVLLVGATSVVDDSLATAFYIVVTVLVIVGYPVAFETATRGRSPGKMALGLRVVSDDGGPERFRQALFRGLAGVLEFWVTSGAVALIFSLVSAQGKRLGDIFAGTIVIGERTPREAPPPPMPPGLAAWAAGLELSQLPDELADTARQYLGRWHQLAPEVQHSVGARLAAQVAGCVTPAPPGGVPPYHYLAAVLAERRRRAAARLESGASARPGSDPPRMQDRSGTTPPSPPRTPPAQTPSARPESRRGGFAPPS